MTSLPAPEYKDQLRAEGFARRDGLDKAFRKKAAQRIAEQVLALPDLREAAEERIASFIPNDFTQRKAAIMELTAIKNLLTHCIMDFIEKGYFGSSYDEEDKEIYKSEFDKSWLTEVEPELRDKKAEAEKFNVLKEEITNFYSTFK